MIPAKRSEWYWHIVSTLPFPKYSLPDEAINDLRDFDDGVMHYQTLQQEAIRIAKMWEAYIKTVHHPKVVASYEATRNFES